MGKPPKAPAFSEAIVLSIQLLQQVDRSGVKWVVDVMRPGRDGHFSKSWSNATGQLVPIQLTDLSTWAQGCVENAIVAWNGVQGVIET